jgi:DNA-binding beta-propeller fold protein YncE
LLRQIVFAMILTSTAAWAQQPSLQTAPAIPFDSVPDFLKLPPDLYLGEAAGVAVNSKGHVFVFSRGGTSGPAYGAAAAQLLEFDADGKFVREIGRNLYAWSFAHAVRIDAHDNIWAVDKGSDMVVEFNPEGRVLMVFGRKKEASDEADGPWAHPSPPAPPVDGMFRQVTDVTWDAAGDSYISDGYINSRVAKYDPDGNWIKSWGEFGKGPGQFRVLHSIQADAQGNIYVADRGNARIQVFDGDGNLIRIIQVGVPFDYVRARPAIGPKPGAPDGSLASYGAALTMAPGSPWALCITPPPNQVLYSADAFPGRIYKLTLDGKVLGVLGETGKQLKQFGWIHEIACPSENELYVAELLNWRIQKLILHPQSQ